MDPMIDLEPAEQAADATVSALQGAPAAPMPVTPAASATPALGAEPAAPQSPALQAALGAMSEASSTFEPLDIAGPAMPGQAPPVGPTTSVSTQQSGTASQIKGQAEQLGQAQDAERQGTQQALQDVARNDVIAWAAKRGREELERQRLEREQSLTAQVKDRTMRELDAISKEQDDPMRVFSGEAGAWPVVSTILGMVTFAAMGGGVPGVLLGLTAGLNRAVRDDIARQRGQRGSRLEYLTEVLGDARLAEKRLAVEQTGLVAMQAETMAAEEKARGTFGQLGALAEKLRADHAREAQNFAQGHETKIATETLSDFTASLQAQAALKKNEPENVNPETAEEFALMRANGVEPNDRGNMSQYQGFADVMSKTEAKLNNVDMADQLVQRLSKGEDVPGLGWADERWNSSRLLSTKEGSQMSQAFLMAKEDFVRERSGAAISDSEMARLDRIVAGRGTKEDVLAGIQIMRNGYESLRRVAAQANPRFERVYNGMGQLRSRRKRADAGAQKQERKRTEAATAVAHEDMTNTYDDRNVGRHDTSAEEQADRLLAEDE